ncbi:MAG: sugar-binding protein [Armatimonadota bacterium]|nr:sugar-binding protein [Armatimonadota bacterium]
MWSARSLIFVILLLLSLIIGLNLEAADRVTCYTAWDDAFFYLAAEVQDPDVEATNTTHMSNPWEDDAIEVFLETDAKKAPDRSANTFQMSVSAGGGSSFLIGESGGPKPKIIYTFKYAKKVQGTLNKSEDRDIGYVIELAMPWREMGGPPRPGQVMGFNVICRMRGENTGFVSFSPNVKTEEDVQIPAKWGTIKLVDIPTVIAIQDGAVVCRKVVARAPLIDGNLSPGEWNPSMSFQITKPEPPALPQKQKYLIERLSFAPYYYNYQTGLFKKASNGAAIQLTDHPLEGIGPWFSGDRVQWHKDQCTEVRRAGIDIILPVYEEHGNRNLLCLVQALKELKAENQDYPLVGMLINSTAATEPNGSSNNQEVLYKMIRDFFVCVPEEFRAVVQLPPEKGGNVANIVFLGPKYNSADFDTNTIEYCNKHFAEDFGGASLIWIAVSHPKSKIEAIDGYWMPEAGLGLKYDDGGWIDIACIGPGFDDSAINDSNPKIRSRMDGTVYRKDWDTLIAKQPNWVVVDSWNGFHEGSEICPSRQYGVKYVGLTRINMLRFNGMRALDAKFIKHNTPSVMLPGALYQINVTVRNAGTKPWYAGQGFFLACRWYKDGRLFADTGARLPIQSAVLAGKTIEKTMGIRATDQDGKPLPEGNYELRWEMTGLRDTWFSAGGDTPLCVPVRIGTPDNPRFTIVDSTMPAFAKPGSTYTVVLRLRNDGQDIWKASDCSIGYRWFDPSDASKAKLTTESAAKIPLDVEPGRVVEVTLPVLTPPVNSSDEPSEMVLKWEVFNGKRSIGLPGIGCGSQLVCLAHDYGLCFVESTTPKEMVAGKPAKVTLKVKNNGVDSYPRGKISVGYHWYYLDGSEALWDGEITPVDVEVKPGDEIIVQATVTPPLYDGNYYLVWDFLVDNKLWMSTIPATRGNDILVIPVSVRKGKLVVVNLDKLYDADIISFDTDRSDGDFDGKGSTFPAEMLPPDAIAISASEVVLPSSYFSNKSGMLSETKDKKVAFKYPPKSDKFKNAITCKGQTINLKRGKYTALHLLGTSPQDAEGVFVLKYAKGTESRKLSFSAWNEEPKYGEKVAISVFHHHTPNGDMPGKKCYLYHYVIPLDPSQELMAVQLPTTDNVKILAMTLEQAE